MHSKKSNLDAGEFSKLLERAYKTERIQEKISAKAILDESIGEDLKKVIEKLIKDEEEHTRKLEDVIDKTSEMVPDVDYIVPDTKRDINYMDTSKFENKEELGKASELMGNEKLAVDVYEDMLSFPEELIDEIYQGKTDEYYEKFEELLGSEGEHIELLTDFLKSKDFADAKELVKKDLSDEPVLEIESSSFEYVMDIIENLRPEAGRTKGKGDSKSYDPNMDGEGDTYGSDWKTLVVKFDEPEELKKLRDLKNAEDMVRVFIKEVYGSNELALAEIDMMGR